MLGKKRKGGARNQRSALGIGTREENVSRKTLCSRSAVSAGKKISSKWSKTFYRPKKGELLELDADPRGVVCLAEKLRSIACSATVFMLLSARAVASSICTTVSTI